MNQKVCSVARFGGIMLRRSWGFRVFAVISVLLIIFLPYLLQGGIGWGESAYRLYAEAGWVFLDECELPEGENRVALLHKGTEGQRLMADAVKWVRVRRD